MSSTVIPQRKVM